MVETREAIGVATGIPLLKWIFKWMFIIIVVGLVFYLFYSGFIWNFFSTGGGSVLYAGTISPILEKIKINDVIAYIRYYREHPAEAIYKEKGGWEANVDANVANKNLGIKIKDFKATQNSYYDEEDVKAVGRININSLKHETKVTFNCSLNDYNKEGEILFEREDYLEPETNIFTFYENSPNTLGVTCIFPDGANVEKGKDMSGRSVKLFADYDFITDNYLPIYILNKVDLDDLNMKGENPFEYYGTTSRYLDVKERSTAHSPTYGPMKLELWIHNQQPLTEGIIYNLGVEFKSSGSEWNGVFKKLNHLYIFIPDYFDLIMETGSDFIEVNTFIDVPVGYKVYELNEDALRRANNICSDFNDILDKRCTSRVVNGITFTSEFKINQVIKEGLYTDNIRLRADYVYRTHAIDSIIVRKTPQLV